MSRDSIALGSRRSLRVLFQPFFAFSRSLPVPLTHLASRFAQRANPLTISARGLPKSASNLAPCVHIANLLLSPVVERVIVALSAIQVAVHAKRLAVIIREPMCGSRQAIPTPRFFAFRRHQFVKKVAEEVLELIIILRKFWNSVCSEHFYFIQWLRHIPRLGETPNPRMG
jgi:hypothetical protein